MTDFDPPVEALTLDFYQTLVFHRTGEGRGRALMQYLDAEGLDPDPWEHGVLYDVLEPHAREYDPAAPADDRERYYRRFSRRVFERLRVTAPPEEADRRAGAIWELLGPASLGVFDDAPGALAELRARGYPLAIASNWQCGLGHFCVELGLASHFEHVLASAEVDSEKPDSGIFLEACERLGVPPQRTLHVGDSLLDDVEGARGAGLHTLLIVRGAGAAPAGVEAVHDLCGLLALLPRTPGAA